MDILGGVMDFVSGGIGKQIFGWTVGGAVSVWAVNGARKLLMDVSNQIVRKVKGEIANIEDENLQQAARHVVRYVANQLPKASSDEKLQFAIRKLQDITPDILVPDEKVKVLVESAYADFKRELRFV